MADDPRSIRFAILADLHIAPEKMGYLPSAFFWSYVGFQILSGWLVVGRLGSFQMAFVAASGMLCGAAILYGLVLGPERAAAR